MLEDVFIPSFCTGHVAAPNKVSACGCLLSHKPSDFAGGGASPQGLFLMHGVEVSPLSSSLFGLETSRRMYTFITSFCTGHVAAPNNVRACDCLLSHRSSDFAGVSSRSVLMHVVKASPLPSSLFGLETSRRLFS